MLSSQQRIIIVQGVCVYMSVSHDKTRRGGREGGVDILMLWILKEGLADHSQIRIHLAH